jgi:hypothetical protein
MCELLGLVDAEIDPLKTRSVVGNAPLATNPGFNM